MRGGEAAAMRGGEAAAIHGGEAAAMRGGEAAAMRGGEAAAIHGGEALAWALTIRRRGVTWHVSAAKANERTDTTGTHWHRLPSGRHRLTARHGADERRRQRLQGTLEHARTKRGRRNNPAGAAVACCAPHGRCDGAGGALRKQPQLAAARREPLVRLRAVVREDLRGEAEGRRAGVATPGGRWVLWCTTPPRHRADYSHHQQLLA